MRQRFYPDVSGVLRSWNFYPIAPSTSEDGIATVALGLGRAVVDGGKCLMFSPRYPQNLVQFSSVNDMLTNSQSEFWAIDLSENANDGASARERKFTLRDAEKDGTLHAVGSTYSADNDAIYDGMSRAGARVVSFAPILKYGRFPLAPVLETLMRVGEQGLAKPVEIEFAVRLPQASSEAAEFGFLQMRPLVLSRETEELKLDEVDPAQVLCRSSNVLGNGRISDIRDVVMVDFHRFERAQSYEVAEAVAYFNSKLNQEGQAVSADWRGTVGIERSVAGNSGGVGPGVGCESDCGGRLPRLSRDTVAGESLLSEPDGIPGGVLHGESGCGRGIRGLGVAGCADRQRRSEIVCGICGSRRRSRW